MKKFWLSLGLTLFLVGLGGGGYYGFGTSPSFGQEYYVYCDPDVRNCYNNYYSAPYADPESQYFYYVVPQQEGPAFQERQAERRDRAAERRDRAAERRDRERERRGQ